MKKENELQLFRLIKRYCEVNALTKPTNDLGRSNLAQIRDGHDEFAILAQIINILLDEKAITSDERTNGLERIRRRKDLFAKFLNENE
ncbi:hypothetical protein [Lacticaseibacillus paracasei]|uniref:hypothetical protein n=1 Tax=Lacticaseibacillus paracasei TaxID=1597 RepID=UPI00192A71AA|nr:hypothetical protein [Lacticaseibacillus paracasei]CAD7484153.1 hypothetical protein LPIBR_50034 [Lacticaseibacillus paracasei]